jgi:hypothetical protein
VSNILPGGCETCDLMIADFSVTMVLFEHMARVRLIISLSCIPVLESVVKYNGGGTNQLATRLI